MNFNQSNNVTEKSVINYVIIWLISLLSIKFYTLFISYSIGKGLVLTSVVLTLSILALLIVYDRSGSLAKGFRLPVYLMFSTLVISAFAASYFHKQNFGTTLFAQNEFYLLSFYFLLHKIKPDPRKLLDMFVTLGLICTVIYFIQYLIYPTKITSASMMIDRGTLRIFMPGFGFAYSSYFILLSRFYVTKRTRHLLLLVPIVIVFFLMGTRQILAVAFLLTVISIILSRTIRSKFFVFFLLAACVIPIYYIFIDVFNNMLELTQNQVVHAQSNVRYKAASYFLFNFNGGSEWLLTGNGFPGSHTDYGKAIQRLTQAYGYYLSDIGILGDLFKFGILYVLAILIIRVKLISAPLAEEYTFVRYESIGELLTIATGAGLQAQSITILCMSMYIADANKELKMKSKDKILQDSIESTDQKSLDGVI